MNFFDPHAPYRPPPPHDRGLAGPVKPRELVAALKRLRAGPRPPPAGTGESWKLGLEAMRAGYDAEIAYMDHHLGHLLSALSASARSDECLIAITSDHGESFGEHQYLPHGAHLYEDGVRVPLMIRFPRHENAATRVANPVQNHRLFGTFLEAAGIEVPAAVGAPGLDSPGDAIVTEVMRSDASVRLFGSRLDRDLRAIYSHPYKLIQSSTGAVELFHLRRNPLELENLASGEGELARSLEEQLERIAAERPPLFDPDERARLPPETERALRALGYGD